MLCRGAFSYTAVEQVQGQLPEPLLHIPGREPVAFASIPTTAATYGPQHRWCPRVSPHFGVRRQPALTPDVVQVPGTALWRESREGELRFARSLTTGALIGLG